MMDFSVTETQSLFRETTVDFARGELNREIRSNDKDATFQSFSDTLAADEVELNFKYVIQVSLCRRLAYAGHPPVKSAILATDATMIHYARLHALLTQGSPINVRVFKDRQEAAKWLGVSVDLLAPSANHEQ